MIKKKSQKTFSITQTVIFSYKTNFNLSRKHTKDILMIENVFPKMQFKTRKQRGTLTD